MEWIKSTVVPIGDNGWAAFKLRSDGSLAYMVSLSKPMLESSEMDSHWDWLLWSKAEVKLIRCEQFDQEVQKRTEILSRSSPFRFRFRGNLEG